MTNDSVPNFEFLAPQGYFWLLEHGLIGFKPNSGLQPWYFLDKTSAFLVHQRWPSGPSAAKLIAFAKRQDNDDIGCFEYDEEGGTGAVLVIHGWTSNGYDIVARYSSFWDWLK